MKRLLFFLLFLFISCGIPSRLAKKEIDSIMRGTVTALFEESDAVLAEAALPTGLKLIEGLLYSYPGDINYAILGSQAYCSYSLGYVENRDTLRAIALYHKGMEIAEKILGYDPAQLSPETLNNYVKNTPKEKLPLLFWYAFNWSCAINLQISEPSAAMALTPITIMMDQITLTIPDYYYYSVHIFWGAYYAMLPPLAGGDIEKSRLHFETAFNGNHRNFLLTHYYFLKYYCLTTMDEELFDKTVAEVMAFPLDRYPEFRLANQIAIDRIRDLIKQKENYF